MATVEQRVRALEQKAVDTRRLLSGVEKDARQLRRKHREDLKSLRAQVKALRDRVVSLEEAHGP